MGRLSGDNLHEIAVLERRGQRAEAVIDAHSLAVIANLGVDAIGEIHRRGALTQTHHITAGSEHVDLLIEQVFFD